jgi:hypothetical protein
MEDLRDSEAFQLILNLMPCLECSVKSLNRCSQMVSGECRLLGCYAVWIL